MKRFLECCCTSVDEVRAAERGGASRIELCSRLEVGGVTPSEELLRGVLAAAGIPVNVLIRPDCDRLRPEGFTAEDFVYDEEDVQKMLGQIAMCAAAERSLHSLRSVEMTGKKPEGRVAGVVVGALTAEGQVDMATMLRLVGAARAHGLSVSFHRAFDVCADPLKAFGDICALDCDRLLTSGHEATALEGAGLIATLVERGGIIVMPGGGIRQSNIDEIAFRTGAREFHASAIFFKP